MTPIRKGSNPVKIPFAIKSTDRTFAAWANETRTALRQLEARIPTANTGRAAGGSSKPPFWTAISQVPDSDPATYQVAITLGYLSYQNATATEQEDGVTGWLAPKVQGDDGLVSLEPPANGEDEDWEAPKLALPAVESWVYLRVKTDTDGLPKLDGESFTVEAFDAKQESVHHVRSSPSSGEEEGDYYFLILQTEGNGGDPEKPIARRRITGNREMPNQLIEIENIGGKRELYQGYLVGPDDKHQLRTVEQIEGDGVVIIEPLDGGTDAVDPVVVDGVIITQGTPAVPPEEEGETIKWRRIDGRGSNSETDNGSTKQIEVREREGLVEDSEGRKRNIVEVVGNDFTESHASVSRFSISFDDGLVTSFLKEEADGEGWWGTVSWVDLASSAIITLTFEAGILKTVFAGAYGVGVEEPGTEAAPGVVSQEF